MSDDITQQQHIANAIEATESMIAHLLFYKSDIFEHLTFKPLTSDSKIGSIYIEMKEWSNASIFNVLYNKSTSINITYRYKNEKKNTVEDVILSLDNYIKVDNAIPIMTLFYNKADKENLKIEYIVPLLSEYYNGIKGSHDILENNILAASRKSFGNADALKWNVIFSLANYLRDTLEWYGHKLVDGKKKKIPNFIGERNGQLYKLLQTSALDDSIGIMIYYKEKSIVRLGDICFAWNIIGIADAISQAYQRSTSTDQPIARVEIFTFDYIHTDAYYEYLSSFDTTYLIVNIHQNYLNLKLFLSDKNIGGIEPLKILVLESNPIDSDAIITLPESFGPNFPYVLSDTYENVQYDQLDAYTIRENIVDFLMDVIREASYLGKQINEDFKRALLTDYILDEILQTKYPGIRHYYDIEREESMVYWIIRKRTKEDKQVWKYLRSKNIKQDVTGTISLVELTKEEKLQYKYTSSNVSDGYEYSSNRRKMIIKPKDDAIKAK